MSKIICDVCGTSYPDTAEQCPICGCSRDAAADLLKDDLLLDGEPEGGQSGGRMSSQRRKEIFDYDEVNVDRQKKSRNDPPTFDDEEEEYEEGGGSNTFVVILLTVLIAVLLMAAGFLFFPEKSREGKSVLFVLTGRAGSGRMVKSSVSVRKSSFAWEHFAQYSDSSREMFIPRSLSSRTCFLWISRKSISQFGAG